MASRAPSLMTITVGNDSFNDAYDTKVNMAAQRAGVTNRTVEYPADVTEAQLLDRIAELNVDDSVDGILLLRPLPSHLNERRLFDSVSLDKDVYGHNTLSYGRLMTNQPTAGPCSALAVVEYIKASGVETIGRNVVVLGDLSSFSKPVVYLLYEMVRNGTVSACHRLTPREDVVRLCRSADIIITSAREPGLVTADMVKEGAAVFDLGYTSVKDPATGNNKMVGDTDFEEVRKVAGYITPVPCGVASKSIELVLKNTITAAENFAQIKEAANAWEG